MGEWNKGLFSCFDDIGLCLLTYIVPCVTFGKTMEAMGKQTCIMGAILMFVPIVNLICWVQLRGEIREKYGIEGSLFGDLFSICCCSMCALVQENAQAASGNAADMVRS